MSSMKGSQQRCRHCKSEEVKVNRANETIQCEICDRILEERYNDFRTTMIMLERDAPFPIVMQDSLSKYKFDESQLENDPFHSTGFITAFSQCTLQPMGAFTLTARTFPGELAELERILGDLGLDQPSPNKIAVLKASEARLKISPADRMLRNVLTAYFHVQEMCDLLELNRDDCDEAIRMFKAYLDRNGGCKRKNVDFLVLGALLLAQRNNGRQSDMEQISEVSGVAVKDIQMGVQLMQSMKDSGTEPVKSNVASYLPQFCSMMSMPATTEQLAAKISRSASKHGVCARRNPQSVAAAVMYLAFNLEDQKKTQTEICKVTGLTEVTLRKVYKELLAGHQLIVPSDYTPKVPLKRLLPVGGLAGLKLETTPPKATTQPPGTAPAGAAPTTTAAAPAGVTATATAATAATAAAAAGAAPTGAHQQADSESTARAPAEAQRATTSVAPAANNGGSGGAGQAAGLTDQHQQMQQAFAQMAACLPFPAFPFPPLAQGASGTTAVGEAQAKQLLQFQQLLAQQLQAMQRAQQESGQGAEDSKKGTNA